MAKMIEIDNIPTLIVQQAQDLKDYQLIDVRREDEFNAELGHIENAQLKTLGPELMEFLEAQSNKNQKMVFICRSGARSAKATELAMEMGHTNVFNLQGGMIAWNEAGFAVEKD